jgi:hypothetical protein
VRRIHLLRVDAEPSAFAPLLSAAAAAGLRIGWLDLRGEASPPPSLAAALAAGGDRAVAVGEGCTVVARARRGPALLRELVRQQFLGCVAVLVRGGVEAPRLAPLGEGWVVEVPGGPTRTLDGPSLVAALGEPRPFAPSEPMT